MGWRKTELLKVARRWRSQLQLIPGDDGDDEDSQWGPTSAELLSIVTDGSIALDRQTHIDWENVPDDLSSDGEDLERVPEEDPALVEAMEALEALAIANDPCSDSPGTFEVCDSEDGSVIESPSRKRLKY